MDSKRCGCCKQIKALSEFFRDKAKPDGITSSCKVCRYAQKLKSLSKGDRLAKKSAHYKEWYQANKEIVLQKKRDKRKTPEEKEKTKQYVSRYRALLGEEVWKARRKKYRENGKEVWKAYNKKRAEAYPDAEVRAEIRSTAKYAKLSNEEIPQELIEVYRLIRFINRRVKNEDSNNTTR